LYLNIIGRKGRNTIRSVLVPEIWI